MKPIPGKGVGGGCSLCEERRGPWGRSWKSGRGGPGHYLSSAIDKKMIIELKILYRLLDLGIDNNERERTEPCFVCRDSAINTVTLGALKASLFLVQLS